jgi:hypothetical protein
VDDGAVGVPGFGGEHAEQVVRLTQGVPVAGLVGCCLSWAASWLATAESPSECAARLRSARIPARTSGVGVAAVSAA